DGAGRVFVGTTDRRIVALHAKNGEVAWRWKIGNDVQGPGFLFRNRVVFAAFDAVLYSLDRDNGNLAWRAPLPSRPIGGPLLVGEDALLACRETEVLGYDLATGKPLGGLRATAEIRTWPLVVGRRLFLGLRDRTVVAPDLGAAGAPGPRARPPAPPATPRERYIPPRPPADKLRAESRETGTTSRLTLKEPEFMKVSRTPFALMTFAGLSLAACGGGEAPKSESAPPKSEAAAPAAAAAAGTASIAGKIKFDGAAPAPDKVKLNADPKCAAMHKEGLERWQAHVTDGGVAGLLVSLK